MFTLFADLISDPGCGVWFFVAIIGLGIILNSLGRLLKTIGNSPTTGRVAGGIIQAVILRMFRGY